VAIDLEYAALDGVTVGSSELSVISGTTSLAVATDPGVYQLFVDDLGNMTKAEEYRIRIYEKVHSGGTKKAIFTATIKGVQSEPFVSPSLILGNGFDATLQKIAGTDRAFDATLRQVA